LPSLLPRIGILIKIIMMTTAITALPLFFLRELFYPLYFHLKGGMHLTNKKNNSYFIAASVVAVVLFTFAIMATAASNIATTTPAAATTAAAATPNNTTTTTPSAIELSPQPVYQRTPSTSGVTPINQTHIGSTFSANGTLTLPNTTETINTTSNGSSITSLTTQSAIGTETIMTEDGETITATFHEILEFPPGAGGANGIAIAVLHTNSTDRLAPLNGTLVVGTDYLYPISEGFSIYWEWIPTPPPSLAPTTMEESPPSLMNTTTTTNATITADDSNATAVAPPEEEVVEEQQQQATPTAPSPLFE
jgi:hypothetical protein